MNRTQARKLTSDTATWYFQNNIGLAQDALKINKKSKVNPKMSDKMWAKLMTEAVISFHEGLDLESDGRRASDNKKLLDKSVEFVGSDAFHDIAFIVSAAGARRPIGDELEQSFQQIQGPGDKGEGEAFTGVEGLTGLIATEADAQAYGQASTIIMQIESSAPSQGAYHQSAQQLQAIASTPGLSQPFASSLSSLGAEYMVLADELTRESGQTQELGAGGTGTTGLPTGLHFQGFRTRAVQARRRILQEALNG